MDISVIANAMLPSQDSFSLVLSLNLSNSLSETSITNFFPFTTTHYDKYSI